MLSHSMARGHLGIDGPAPLQFRYEHGPRLSRSQAQRVDASTEKQSEKVQIDRQGGSGGFAQPQLQGRNERPLWIAWVCHPRSVPEKAARTNDHHTFWSRNWEIQTAADCTTVTQLVEKSDTWTAKTIHRSSIGKPLLVLVATGTDDPVIIALPRMYSLIVEHGRRSTNHIWQGCQINMQSFDSPATSRLGREEKAAASKEMIFAVVAQARPHLCPTVGGRERILSQALLLAYAG